MSRGRTSKSRKASSRRAKRAKRSRCTELRVVDQRPYLRKAVTTCRRLRTELNNKQEQLRVHEESDLNEFNHWLYGNFGRELTRNRELVEELEALRFILHQLEMCEAYCPGKLPAVHGELLERKANGTLHAFEPPGFEGAGGNGRKGSFPEEDLEEEMDAAFEKFFEEIFGEDGDWEDEPPEDFQGFFGKRDDSGDRWKSGASSRDDRLKPLYRTLAKRLHPDRSSLEETLREKRWHELQKAYQERDLEGIQRIEAVCDMDEIGISIKLGLARLEELAEYHRSHLAPLRRALKEAKRHPAFGFSKANRKILGQRVEADLAVERMELHEEIKYLEYCALEIIKDYERSFPGKDADDDDLFCLEPRSRDARPAKDHRQMDLFDF